MKPLRPVPLPFLFGEKYGDEVRVISMGVADDGSYSTELAERGYRIF